MFNNDDKYVTYLLIYNAVMFLYKLRRPKGSFPFAIIIKVLVGFKYISYWLSAIMPLYIVLSLLVRGDHL